MITLESKAQTTTNTPTITPCKSNISKTVPSKKYMSLTDDELVVLTMLDSFAPCPDTLAWPCDYDELMKLAERNPSIASDTVITIIGRLEGFKILDSSFDLDGRQIKIWVSPWSYRNQLRHAINTELIKRRHEWIRANSTPTPTTTAEPTRAA